MVHVDGNLYAMGGWDGGGPLNRADKFSISQNKWTTLPNMQTPTHRHCAVEVNGNTIWNIGGHK